MQYKGNGFFFKLFKIIQVIRLCKRTQTITQLLFSFSTSISFNNRCSWNVRTIYQVHVRNKISIYIQSFTNCYCMLQPRRHNFLNIESFDCCIYLRYARILQFWKYNWEKCGNRIIKSVLKLYYVHVKSGNRNIKSVLKLYFQTHIGLKINE